MYRLGYSSMNLDLPSVVVVEALGGRAAGV